MPCAHTDTQRFPRAHTESRAHTCHCAHTVRHTWRWSLLRQVCPPLSLHMPYTIHTDTLTQKLVTVQGLQTQVSTIDTHGSSDAGGGTHSHLSFYLSFQAIFLLQS